MLRRWVPALSALLVAASASANAAAITWDRPANIKSAAERLAGILKSRGAAGAYKFISDCYGTQTLAEKYGEGLEACIAQDYMLSEVAAAIYARIPPDKRKEMGVVDPLDLAKAFSRRAGSALAQYKMTEADGNALKKLVDEHGLPVFTKATLPRAGAE